MDKINMRKDPETLPHAIDTIGEIIRTIGNRKPAFFLDYDGTLSPIVKNPEDAILSDKARAIIQQLAKDYTVALVSGRDRADVKGKVNLENLIYAGSHGFDITGPDGLEMQYEGGVQALPALDKAEKNLLEKLKTISGARVERKKYAIAVHFRNVAEEEVPAVKSAVYEELEQHDNLKKGGGKMILELKPDIDWHKGRAIRWLLDALNLNEEQYTPLFIGDDATDEDALEAIEADGTGILVGSHGEQTAASYRLNDTDEVALFLEQLYAALQKENK